MKILCSGGGTLGPVTPLLGFLDALRPAYPSMQVVWVGTPRGVEHHIIPRGAVWYSLPEAKFRRYISVSFFGDIYRFVVAFIHALFILRREKPNMCVSAGGYVSVPVHMAAWLLRIPTWVHQLDASVGLANSIMAPKAQVVTTSLVTHRGRLPERARFGFGTWVRHDVLHGDLLKGEILFGAKKNDMCVLVLGGGTGAQAINAAVCAGLTELGSFNIRMLHLTGEGRGGDECVLKGFSHAWYRPVVFLGADMSHALARADIVVGRAGFATIAEAAALKKPFVLIPKAGHQEDNARYVVDAGAARVIPPALLTGAALVRELRMLLHDSALRASLGNALFLAVPSADAEKTQELLERIAVQHK
jgi:UDP-N-acetylglucosamine--N-acetylmuramyl-(pentapeptide) pyrophosphoryl-undecaprenol N-acetylglucosamine transferase